MSDTWRSGCLGVIVSMLMAMTCQGIDPVNTHLLRGRSEVAFKKELERKAMQKVEAISAACELRPDQLAKLRFMAMGDVNRAAQDIAALRHTTKGMGAIDPHERNESLQLLLPFTAKLQGGVHGEGSLLAKCLEHTLDPSQQTQYQQYLAELEKQRYHLLTLNLVTSLDERMPLLKRQREQLVERIDQCPIPKTGRISDAAMGYIRLGSIPEKELKEFLDDEQVQFITKICEPYRSMREALP